MSDITTYFKARQSESNNSNLMDAPGGQNTFLYDDDDNNDDEDVSEDEDDNFMIITHTRDHEDSDSDEEETEDMAEATEDTIAEHTNNRRYRCSSYQKTQAAAPVPADISVRTVIASGSGLTLTANRPVKAAIPSTRNKKRKIMSNSGESTSFEDRDHGSPKEISKRLVDYKEYNCLQKVTAKFEKATADHKLGDTYVYMRCTICKTTVNGNNSKTRQHLRCVTHRINARRQERTIDAKKRLRGGLQEWLISNNAQGGTKNMDIVFHRVLVLKNFMKAGKEFLYRNISCKIS